MSSGASERARERMSEQCERTSGPVLCASKKEKNSARLFLNHSTHRPATRRARKGRCRCPGGDRRHCCRGRNRRRKRPTGKSFVCEPEWESEASASSANRRKISDRLRQRERRLPWKGPSPPKDQRFSRWSVKILS